MSDPGLGIRLGGKLAVKNIGTNDKIWMWTVENNIVSVINFLIWSIYKNQLYPDKKPPEREIQTISLIIASKRVK